MKGPAWERASSLLAEALELTPEAVTAGTAIGREPRWDSLAHLRIIEAVEEAVGRPLDPEAIVAIECLGDIAAILERQDT